MRINKTMKLMEIFRIKSKEAERIATVEYILANNTTVAFPRNLGIRMNGKSLRFYKKYS